MSKKPQKTRLSADASNLLQHKQVVPRTQQEQLRVPQCRGAAAGPLGRAGGCCWVKKKKKKKKDDIARLTLLPWSHTDQGLIFVVLLLRKKEEMRRKEFLNQGR